MSQSSIYIHEYNWLAQLKKYKIERGNRTNQEFYEWMRVIAQEEYLFNVALFFRID